jgi:hypothetical protein
MQALASGVISLYCKELALLVQGVYATANLRDCWCDCNIRKRSLYEKDLPVIHVCDSTAIAAREKAVKKAGGKDKKQAKRRRRPQKGSPKAEKEPSFLKHQLSLGADTILNSLNKNCSFGCKKNSQGNVFYWKEYKLHLDVSDIGFPLSAFVSGANVMTANAPYHLKR